MKTRRGPDTLGFAPWKFREIILKLGRPTPSYDLGLMKTRITKANRDKLVTITTETYHISREEATTRVRQRFTTGTHSGVVDWDKEEK